jgi:hypothetical protein
MHRFTALLIALTFIMVVGCRDQSPTGISGDQALAEPEVVASHGQPGKPLPIHGTVSGFPTHQIFDPAAIAQRCTPGSDWVIGFYLTGPVAHLGQVTVTAEHCSQAGPGTYSDGTITFISANGDELWGTYHTGTFGMLSPTVVWFEDTIVLSGGTGRFVNATGGGSEVGTFDLATGVIELELNGWISYDASDRRN